MLDFSDLLFYFSEEKLSNEQNSDDEDEDNGSDGEPIIVRALNDVSAYGNQWNSSSRIVQDKQEFPWLEHENGSNASDKSMKKRFLLIKPTEYT